MKTFYFKSRKFVKPIVNDWIVWPTIIVTIFLLWLVPSSLRSYVEIIFMFIYLAIILNITFYFFFKTFEFKNLNYQIQKLEEQKEETIKYKGIFGNEDLLISLIRLKEDDSIKNANFFIHVLKSKKEHSEDSNFERGTFLLFILLIGQHSFDHFLPLGPGLIMLIVTLSIVYIIGISLLKMITKRSVDPSSIFVYIMILYFFFFIGKETYSRNFGDEEMFSYFEKSKYTTQYYVNISSSKDDGKNYRLPADINVYFEIGGDGFGILFDFITGSHDKRVIDIDKVYFPDGRYLNFKNCSFADSFESICTDQFGIDWNIELTESKVE